MSMTLAGVRPTHRRLCRRQCGILRSIYRIIGLRDRESHIGFGRTIAETCGEGRNLSGLTGQPDALTTRKPVNAAPPCYVSSLNSTLRHNSFNLRAMSAPSCGSPKRSLISEPAKRVLRMTGNLFW